MGLNIDPTKKKWYSWTLLVSSLKWPALIRLCDTVHRQTELNKKKKSEVKRVKCEIEFISVLYSDRIEFCGFSFRVYLPTLLINWIIHLFQ